MFFSAHALDIMPSAAHLSASSGSGYLVVTSTRMSPTFLISFTETKLLCMFEPGPLARLSENTTSSAVNGVPSWNFTPGADVEEPGRRIALAPLGGQRRLELEVLVAPDQRIVDVGGEGQQEGLLTGVGIHRADVARIGPLEGLGVRHRRHAETGAGDRRQRKRMPETEVHRVTPFGRHTHCRADRSPRPLKLCASAYLPHVAPAVLWRQLPKIFAWVHTLDIPGAGPVS